VHPSRAFRQYNTVVLFSIENFHPLHAAIPPVVDMASFSKPEPVTSMDKFFYMVS
jgi:hypothetical protein